MTASFLCRLRHLWRVLHKKQLLILCCWRHNLVSSSEEQFAACDTIDSDAMEVWWTPPLRTPRHSRFCTDSCHSCTGTRDTRQRHNKLMLQGSYHEQNPRCLQETLDLNMRHPRDLGREKIITRCKLCIPRDLVRRNQEMIHGELRKKFDAVSCEEVFGVQEKALLLMRGFYVTKELVEQRDAI